eukprot:1808276-Amphidinium_carterae.1
MISYERELKHCVSLEVHDCNPDNCNGFGHANQRPQLRKPPPGTDPPNFKKVTKQCKNSPDDVKKGTFNTVFYTLLKFGGSGVCLRGGCRCRKS